MQLIPYFGTQAGNATLLAITNQDEVNGKLLKVRFRSAGNGALPAICRLDFQTAELPPTTAQFTAADRDAWTREGFVEIINTADVPPHAQRRRPVVSPQTADAVDAGRAGVLTADALLAQGRLASRQYHFPDLSTP